MPVIATWNCKINYKNGYAGPYILEGYVGPSLPTSLQPLALRRNAANLSLFYRYYFGRYSSELAQLPFPRGRSTRYSDRLDDFSFTIPRCY